MLLHDLMKATETAAPCPAQWADMTGDDKKRLCADCKLHVFNPAAMTDEEVLDLLTLVIEGERVCMRVFERADGTFLTNNCPVGLKRVREQAAKAMRRVALWLSGMLSVSLIGRADAQDSTKPECSKPKPLLKGTIRPSADGNVDTVQKGVAKDINILQVQPTILDETAGMRTGRTEISPKTRLAIFQRTIAQLRTSTKEMLPQTRELLLAAELLRADDTIAQIPEFSAEQRVDNLKEALSIFEKNDDFRNAAKCSHTLAKIFGGSCGLERNEVEHFHYSKLAQEYESKLADSDSKKLK